MPMAPDPGSSELPASLQGRADPIDTKHHPAAAGTVSVDDPSVFERQMAPWEVLCQALSAGPVGYRTEVLKAPGFVIYRAGFAAATRVQGLTPPNMVAVSAPICLPEGTDFWGRRPLGSGFVGTDGGCVDVTFAAGYEHALALVDLDLLRSSLPEGPLGRLLQALARHRIPAARSCVGELARWIAATVTNAQMHPEVTREAAAIGAVGQDLLGRLAGLADGLMHLPQRPSLQARELGLRRALDYLRWADAGTVSVPELCRAAGVSQRTLQYAFLDAFSLTPQAFIRRRRFHAARWTLLAAHPEQTTVARAAAENGIYQLGRFAGEYARLFGESPSVTLARAPVDPPPSLAIGLPSSRSVECRMPPAGSAMAGTRSQ